MGSQVADYEMAHKGNHMERLLIKLTMSPKVYIPSWVRFPDDFHPVVFASQRLTEQMQWRA
jgi:hypothetical protein